MTSNPANTAAEPRTAALLDVMRKGGWLDPEACVHVDDPDDMPVLLDRLAGAAQDRPAEPDWEPDCCTGHHLAWSRPCEDRPAEPGLRRAIDRMLRAADTETRYWIQNILNEEVAASPPPAPEAPKYLQRMGASKYNVVADTPPAPEVGLDALRALDAVLQMAEDADKGESWPDLIDAAKHVIRTDGLDALEARLTPAPADPTDE